MAAMVLSLICVQWKASSRKSRCRAIHGLSKGWLDRRGRFLTGLGFPTVAARHLLQGKLRQA